MKPLAIVSLLALLVAPAAAEEAGAADAAADASLRRIATTLERVVVLLERQVELDRAGLAMRRLERVEARLDAAEADAESSRQALHQLDGELRMLESRTEAEEATQGFEPPTEDQRRLLEDLQVHSERLASRRRQVEQEIAEAEIRAARLRGDVDLWHAIVEEHLSAERLPTP